MLQYGVMVCAVLDPRNLNFPPVNVAQKFLKFKTDELFIEAPSEPTGGSSFTSGNFTTISLIIVVILAIAAAVALFFLWIRRQRNVIRKKRIDLEVLRRQQQQHQRYVELPKKSDFWELERSKLVVYDENKLGAGAFGAVYLGKLIAMPKSGNNASKQPSTLLSVHLMRSKNSLVAVKMLPEYADEMSKSEFLREIALMKTLGYHERLVNMLACVISSEPYCLVVEYCVDGDLLNFLRERCKYMLELDEAKVDYSDPNCEEEFDREMIMTVKQLLVFAVQISYGLEYLAQKGFVHRDVAARNVLVHDKNYAKIGDFGLCRFIYADSSNYKSRGGRLPIKWMSPEAIRHYEFTTSSDIWSFGILMFEIITLGGSPYPGIQPDDMLNYLEKGNRMAQPDNCPDEFYKVMMSCWQSDHRKRPSFSAIRQQLALQLEDITDEYSYLKLDAQKDYYNASYREKLMEQSAQRGEMGEEAEQNAEQ